MVDRVSLLKNRRDRRLVYIWCGHVLVWLGQAGYICEMAQAGMALADLVARVARAFPT